MKRVVCAAGIGLGLVCSLLWGSYADYVSATRKFRLIESERVHNTRVVLTSAELNAWVKQEIVESFPQGVRESKLVLGDGAATGSLLIDFGKVRRAQGHPPGWLMSKVLDGERPVEVAVHIRSGGGQATVDVDSVRVSGLVIDGRLLDFLIQYYLLPNYPDAKVGRPVQLAHGIERLDVRPAAVDVVIR